MASELALERYADAGTAARRAAEVIADSARAAIEARDRFVVALSGGSTPLAMLRHLAAADIDWRKVHVTQVDERVAPMGSPVRNLTQLRAVLLDHVPIPAAQVHPMPVDAPDLVVAAENYARSLAALAGQAPVIDLVHLGLGADGHTASLVPGDAVLDRVDADVAITASYQGWQRMTLTFPIINRARSILWLATGAQKSVAVARLVRADALIPASRVKREWAVLLLDQAAAAGLA